MSVKDSEPSTVAAVQVAVRIRPLSDKDRSQPRFAHATNDDVLQAHDNNKVVISPPHNKVFTFDHVFGPQTQQAEIFAALGEKSIRKFVEGYNVTMLAYGQTSSGKTYTVGTAHHTGRYHPEQEGIVPRAMALLFDLLHQNDTRPISPATSLSASSSIDGSTSSTKGRLRPVSRISYSSYNNTNSTSTANNNSNSNNSSNAKPKYKFSVKVSFVEIYNEELIDLLNFAPPNERPPVTIREDTKGQIYWTGVKEMNVSNTDDVLMYLQQGTQNRATGATDMNEQSSRSHAIFSVTLRQEKWTPTNNNSSPTPGTASPTSPRSKPRPLSAMNLRMNDALSGNDDAGEWIITTSKLHFVDLAGSERLKRTAAEGDRRKEGININGGLLALGNVISALGDASKKSTHIPYRDSKLTRLLQDSLGGSAMTLMIACVSPMEYNISETLNTLQYANRARNIKNRMEKNEVEEWLTTDNLDLLRATITKLKNELRNRSPQQKGEGRLSVSPIPRHMHADGDQVYQEQHMAMVVDLQRQLEEASTEAAVTKERNRVVENELQRMKSLVGSNNSGCSNPHGDQDLMGGLSFQHSVEPVIEEYEKSMATLESQLTMARAAVTHSDIRIDELQAITQSQEDMVNDLTAKVNKYKEIERHNQGYIEELEGKLLHSVNDAVQDEELLNELKNRIMKFKEVDDRTELYILELEKQLSTNEAEYTSKLQQLQQTIANQKEHIEQLEHDLRELQLGRTLQKDGNNGIDNPMEYLKERQALQQHIAKLEHDLMNVTTRLQQYEQNGLVSPALVENDSALEEHHQQQQQQQQQQRLAMSPPPPSTMDPDHEKRKRMFSGGNLRGANSKSTLLQSTLASLNNVQSDYVALKERYKHWTVASRNNLGDDDPHPQGLAPTMSTGSSLSSLDSISASTGTTTLLTTTASTAPAPLLSSSSSSSSSTTTTTTTKNNYDDGTIINLQTKTDDVIKQYQNQLQRIHGAIQRVAKLEQTTTSSSRSALPISPTSPSPSPPPRDSSAGDNTDQRDALLDLEQQLKDRQLSLQEACTRFEIEMKGDLAALKQLYSLQHISSSSSSSAAAVPPHPSTSTHSTSSYTSSSSFSSKTHDTKETPSHDQQKIRHLIDQIMQRLSNASQDVELHRSKTFVLQTKLQKLEVAFHAQQHRKSSASEDQDGIEQLMKKMDAIKIQLESRDIKSISVKE